MNYLDELKTFTEIYWLTRTQKDFFDLWCYYNRINNFLPSNKECDEVFDFLKSKGFKVPTQVVNSIIGAVIAYKG